MNANMSIRYILITALTSALSLLIIQMRVGRWPISALTIGAVVAFWIAYFGQLIVINYTGPGLSRLVMFAALEEGFKFAAILTLIRCSRASKSLNSAVGFAAAFGLIEYILKMKNFGHDANVLFANAGQQFLVAILASAPIFMHASTGAIAFRYLAKPAQAVFFATLVHLIYNVIAIIMDKYLLSIGTIFVFSIRSALMFLIGLAIFYLLSGRDVNSATQ